MSNPSEPVSGDLTREERLAKTLEPWLSHASTCSGGCGGRDDCTHARHTCECGVYLAEAAASRDLSSRPELELLGWSCSDHGIAWSEARPTCGCDLLPLYTTGDAADLSSRDAEAELDRITEALEREFLFWLTLGPGEVDGATAAARLRRIVDPNYTSDRLSSRERPERVQRKFVPCPHGHWATWCRACGFTPFDQADAATPSREGPPRLTEEEQAKVADLRQAWEAARHAYPGDRAVDDIFDLLDMLDRLSAPEGQQAEGLSEDEEAWLERLSEWDHDRVWLDGEWWEIDHWGRSADGVCNDVVMHLMDPQPEPVTALAPPPVLPEEADQ